LCNIDHLVSPLSSMAEQQKVQEVGASYQLLINKLDKFIRKYYINKALRGVLISVALCVFLFLVYAMFESQLYLPTGGRKLMFFSYIALFTGSFGYMVVLPLLKYFRLGKTISHEQAAQILGDHFIDVEDKLLNVLQLKKTNDTVSNALITASIDQKSDQIKVVPFKKAIDLNKNRKYLRYAAPPVLALMVILFTDATLITDSTHRIINNDETFERPAPYIFTFEEDDFEVVQYEDFRLNIKVDGEKLPNEAFIRVDNYDYRLTKETPNTFSYLFSNVRKDTEFKVFAGRESTSDKTLKILPKPKMLDFQVSLNYPRYTGRKSEVLHNNGDFAAPEGTSVRWTFDTRSTDKLSMTFDESESIQLEKEGGNSFGYKKGIYKR